ncbi:MAG: lecithin retinol acyltransferase family protein [Bryobacteraceae bacterium]
MARSDHIFCRRFGYTHHGIDAGDGTVTHYTGERGQKAGFSRPHLGLAQT